MVAGTSWKRHATGRPIPALSLHQKLSLLCADAATVVGHVFTPAPAHSNCCFEMTHFPDDWTPALAPQLRALPQNPGCVKTLLAFTLRKFSWNVNVSIFISSRQRSMTERTIVALRLCAGSSVKCRVRKCSFSTS